MEASPRRLVVALTGGPGAAFGVRLLEALARTTVETHLILSPDAERRVRAETGDPAALRALVHRVWSPDNQAARISSGSFRTEGMIVAPCSLASLAAIANGLATDLIHRAADVTVKERRPLVLLVTEPATSPVHRETLRLAARASIRVMAPSAGAIDGTVRELLSAVGIRP